MRRNVPYSRASKGVSTTLMSLTPGPDDTLGSRWMFFDILLPSETTYDAVILLTDNNVRGITISYVRQ